ncbi:MAG TPA: alpha/beta fold hydrolase [Anaeromyxobacteraceae bacterium]|nr:alpha/beta fold hydrolase [Anaeromyxobacteraceae bacterium]
MSAGQPPPGPAFAPARWLPGPNLQTVFARLARPFPRPPARRERWELPDGDFLDVDRFAGASPGAPLLLVCHGLEGSSRAPYVRGLVAQALRRGFSAAALNFRGCSGEMNRLPRFYHSGETEDLAYAVGRLAGARPGRPLCLCGFSLGGNVVAKYLAERGEAAPSEVVAAAVISVPFDLAASARAVDGPGFWAAVYRERFLRTLRRKALAKARAFEGLLDPARVRAARSFAGFDEVVTAPLHGFGSAAEYWARCSSGQLLDRVRRPLLCLAAADDPIVPEASLPRRAARANPRVTLEVAPGGGHAGFVAGPPWRPRYWAEERAAGFLADAVQLG